MPKLFEAFSDFRSLATVRRRQPNWRSALGFGVARIEYGRLGNIIAVSIPALGWGPEAEDYFAAYMTVLESHGVEFKSTEISAPITKEMVRDLTRVFSPLLKENYQAQSVAGLYRAWEDGTIYIDDKKSKPRYRFVAIMADEKCRSIEAVYLKLLALSEGLTKPGSLNLEGIFGILPNLAWAGNKPHELEYLRENKVALQLAGKYPTITAVDKIPYFLHHVIPADNTRILDSAKVRLGAHLSPGTTVMPGASYINFNAGTLGPSMVEGRISSSATIGPGTDIGGGASILGVLSGGNKTPISVGANCLLGANCVCGISLGDGCIIDAGVAVLAGSKVTISAEEIEALDEVNEKVLAQDRTVFKASDLSGMNGVHFRLDTTTGTLIAFRSKAEIKLNEALH